MGRTKIEWADVTWNPVRGCLRVSEGCRNCYAERMAARFWSGAGGLAEFRGGEARWTGRVELVERKLLEPLWWRKPRRVFVDSMGDLFYGRVRRQWIEQVFGVMALARRHVFMVLTKRPLRMRMLLADQDAMRKGVENAARRLDGLFNLRMLEGRPLPNVWLGVSVEDQRTADERIPDLLATPAALRFVSCEPLLGPVDLRPWLGEHRRQRLDWVIVGGETGPGARPMHPWWVRAICNQATAAGVPFFFKQWGEWLPAGQFGADGDTPTPANTGCWQHGERALAVWPDGRSSGSLEEDDGVVCYQVGRRNAGRLLDGKTWDQMPDQERWDDEG